MADTIQRTTLVKDASETVSYLFDFSQFPEYVAGETLASPSVPAVSGLTIGSPAVTVADRDYVAAGGGIAVTISGGKVTAASAVQTGKYAIGYKKAACTEAVFNSAAIDLAASSAAGNSFVARIPAACSGATYSWWGYANSLQAAIDKATY
jgi:hypothetical protein